jgi:hypothetical protein
MGETRKNPSTDGDGNIPLTIRLPPKLHNHLKDRCEKDGMKLGALIVKLIGFALEDTETVLVRKGSVASPAAGSGAVVTGESKRRASGER